VSRGRFVVLDGIDGCGKSTQAALLAAALRAETGREPLHVREPGSTRAGERIREVLLSREVDLGAAAEALLFAAARRQMLDELVRPALADGLDVVCERFHPSTYAYQAVGGELDPSRVLSLLNEWAGDPAPDVVVLLEIDPERAAARRGSASDRIEDRGLAFQRAVAEGYRRYACEVPGAVCVDGNGSPEEVHARVLAEVRRVG
jgi:dTMP kinase